MKRPEEDLHRQVAAYLRASLPSAAFWFSVPNQRGTRKRYEMGILKALGVRSGVPDIIIIWEGMFFGIELKAPKGTLSDSQKDTADLIVKAGGFYTVIRSLDALEAYLIAQGMPIKARLAA